MIRRIPQTQIIFSAPNQNKNSKEQNNNQFVTARMTRPAVTNLNTVPQKQNPFVSKIKQNFNDIKSYFSSKFSS